VSALGGGIGVESAIGRGTAIRVVLPPASLDARRLSVAPEPESAAVARCARVLVVDDDPLVGAAVRRALAQDHEVTVVESGAAALDHVRRGARYDVIFRDLMMPVMTGIELHAQLAELDGGQADRMVFATGGAFTPAALAFLERVPHASLEKPFELRELRALVKRFQDG
jgi:CheY-like chemotaxis protein